MQQVFTADYYIGENYPNYFNTPHWHKLKEEFIYSNSGAKCWICEKKNTLLPHHEKYDNLFKERINKDIFILCFDCHTQLHFYKIFFFFNRKTKLNYKSLRKRRFYLRSNYLVHNKRFGLALWYAFRYIMT